MSSEHCFKYDHVLFWKMLKGSKKQEIIKNYLVLYAYMTKAYKKKEEDVGIK